MRKDESQDGGNKKTKLGKFSEKRTFLTPDTLKHKFVSEGIKNVRFSV